ncbi:MAG: hypothetical protein ACC662_06500, partial [Planctomycetota bacterium]
GTLGRASGLVVLVAIVGLTSFVADVSVRRGFLRLLVRLDLLPASSGAAPHGRRSRARHGEPDLEEEDEEEPDDDDEYEYEYEYEEEEEEDEARVA